MTIKRDNGIQYDILTQNKMKKKNNNNNEKKDVDNDDGCHTGGGLVGFLSRWVGI